MSSLVLKRQEPGQSNILGATGSAADSFPRQLTSVDTAKPTMPVANLVGLAGSVQSPQPTAKTSLAWPESNIWATKTNSFGFMGSKNSTPDSTAKTGSGALLNDSVSDGWGRNTSSNQNRLLGSSRRPDTQPLSRPQTGVDASHSNGSVNGNGLSGGSSFFPSARPPTVNLNDTLGHQPKTSFTPTFASGALSFGQSDAPPVYTKFDRPSNPGFQNAGLDPITRSHNGSAVQSPAEERKSFINSNYAHHSMPGSRNSSLPPSRHDGDVPQQQQFESMPVGRLVADSYRRQSTPHALAALGSADQINRAALQFGQLSLNEQRPTQQFSPTNGEFGYSNDAAMSDNMSYSHFSRRGSQQVESNGYQYSNAFQGGYPSSAYGADQFITPLPTRVRTDPAYAGRDFDGRSNSITSSRRDSAQSRESQLSNVMTANGTSWGQVDQRLRHHQLLQQVDPNFAHFLRMQNSPYMMNMQGMQLPQQFFPQGPLFNVNMGSVRDVGPSHSFRSSLLDEFRNNKATKKHELRETFGHVVEFCGDQHGSRFIQTKLETANSEEKARVFEEILPECHQLMTDVFGNYVIQKFFEHGDQTQKKTLAHKMRNHVLSLTLQMYGCRVVQKALEHVLTAEQASLVMELKNDVMRCLKDSNGNHVIQKAIEVCSADMIPFIFDAFRGQVPSLSGHTYGCRVIQRCLEHPDLKIRRTVMSELKNSLPSLVADQFGNYVVQHVVLHGEPEEKKRALDIVFNGLEIFSKHKFASNVVETCLVNGGVRYQRKVVKQLIAGQDRVPPEDTMILGMVKDNFGNYVIQKMCEILEDAEYLEFIEHLQPEINKARRMGCGKQVSSIEKKMMRSPTFDHGRHNTFYASRALSGERTPALTNSNSAQTSSLSSVNGDAVEGATNSRKNSVQSTINHR